MNTKQRVSAQRGEHLAVLAVNESAAIEFHCRGTPQGRKIATNNFGIREMSVYDWLHSGPAFLGTLQFAYALAIEFSGGSRALGIAAATLAQLCLLLPVAIVATGVLFHGSGSFLFSLLARRKSDDAPASS